MKYDDPIVVDPANGVVRGDSKTMPNRGTSSGFVGNDDYRADVDQQAKNRLGSAHEVPDPAFRNVPPGDGHFVSSSMANPNPGSRMSGTDSDAAADDVPNEQQG